VTQRIEEIKARLAKVKSPDLDFLINAPADVAYLLDQLTKVEGALKLTKAAIYEECAKVIEEQDEIPPGWRLRLASHFRRQAKKVMDLTETEK
jgi:hypothetical protein